MSEDGHGDEVERPRMPVDVHTPSAQEVAEHEASSCAVYRSWCPHCTAAKGQANPHRAEGALGDVPEIAIRDRLRLHVSTRR